MKTVLLLSGKKETGKSTLAKVFTQRGFTELSFAEELKLMSFKFAKDLLHADVTLEHFLEQELKIKPMNIPLATKELTPRKLLQFMGTEFVRELVSNDYWVDIIIDKIEKSDQQYFVISDCRVPNEILNFKNSTLISHTLRINRETGNFDDHPSETSLDNFVGWDFVIENNSTMESLIQKANHIADYIQNTRTDI